jgi:hypothetical protein
MSFPVRLLLKGSKPTTVPFRRYFSNRRRRPFRSDLAGSGRSKRQQQQQANQEADLFSPAAIRYRNQSMDRSISDNNALLSNSSVRWATFLVLGIVPIIMFGIVVNSTPHLRMQLKETIDSVQRYANLGASEENPTSKKCEEQMEAIKKSDT